MNVVENKNHEWTIQRHQKHWAEKTHEEDKQNKTKQNKNKTNKNKTKTKTQHNTES